MTLVDAPLYDFVRDGAHLYFTGARIAVVDAGGTHFVGSDGIGRISVDGGPVAAVGGSGLPFLVAVGPTRIHWLDPLGTIGWIDKDGAGVGGVAAGPFDETELYADAMVADADGVTFTNTLLGEVARLTFPAP